ncbi:MAG: T9SS type A sorting domain-containing protein [Chitinophagaceae bacterium]|nr:T9SS type A sorting domain-containing protein [Chitinophagaceae bacterium]
MKKPAILLVAVIISVTAYLSVSQQWFSKKINHQHENHEEEKDEGEEFQSGASKQLSGWFQSKAYPNPENLNGKYQAAWEQFLEIKKKTNSPESRIEAANWTSLGDVSTIGGRVLCVKVDPNNSNNVWAGSASGGIWKSTNGGTNWTSVPTNLPVLGVSSIIVNPSNSNIIYAGTGEVYRVDTSNIGFSVWKTRGTYGIGIIKSTDGGATWTQVMTKISSQLFGIQMLKFDPTNSNTIYACATDGLYRSTNSGSTWSQILSKIYVSDICINPSNTDQLVVGIGNMVNVDKGIYRTTNGSNASPTWTKITAGLPSSFNGYIRLDNVGATRLYASIGGKTGNELYLSTDFGANWFAKTGSAHADFQYWFAHTLAINPSNTNDILIAGVDFFRYTSTDATTGGSKSTISSGSSPIHSDHHDIEYDPNNSNTIYVACDGGVYKSTNGGANWNARNTGLRATQFYAPFGVHPTNANLMIGGLQDNGVVRYNGTTWTTVFGGDGGPSAFAPNGTTVLASNDARGVRRSTTGVAGTYSSVLAQWAFTADDRTAFMAPLGISKSDGNYMYVATDNIHRSTNAGGAWTNTASSSTNYIEQQRKTAITLAVSPTNRDKIYVSTSNIAQNTTNDYLWVNGQPNILKSTTPSTTPYTSIKGTLPNRFVMDMAISQYSDDSVYIVLGGFGTSHVYLTPNGGTTWNSIGAGLPDVPFNAIVIDPVNPQIIYAGCDFGVYVSPDRGQTWIDYNTGLWDATLIMDLQIDANKKLIAVTHGKGVFRGDLYVHSTLPTTLLSFSGTSQLNYNQLTWTVEQEQNLSRYELERSTNGTEYMRVGTISSRNQTTQTVYSYNDNTTLFESYYRLKIINLDGSYTYSSIVFIRRPFGKAEFSVLGNPFQDNIILKYKLPKDQKIVANLFNSSGVLIKREDYAATAGEGVYTLTGLGSIPAGSYFLKIESGNDRQTIKLIRN